MMTENKLEMNERFNLPSFRISTHLHRPKFKVEVKKQANNVEISPNSFVKIKNLI